MGASFAGFAALLGVPLHRTVSWPSFTEPYAAWHAQVGKKYNLYTKITGGQRVDLFGANKGDLPDIWEELIAAGFESGHAYGKAVRTVKSCVGSTWCRYGQQDSVGFAVRVEERYRGIRAPHKIKFAVSGCVRECAEAQCKDVGLIATENG